MQELIAIKENPVVLADKGGITGLIDSYLEEIAVHGGDVLTDWVTCEKYSFLIKKLQEGLKPYVIRELQNYDRAEAMVRYTEMKVVSTPAKYDFTQNEAWLKQKAKVDEETNRLKDIETFIKGLKQSTTVVDEETGETTTFHPAVKSSSETIRSVLS